MRKARAGEGPGPDPGLGPVQGGAGIVPGQDLVPGQSLAPGVAPGIVPGLDPGRQEGTAAEAAHRMSARSKLGGNISTSANRHTSCNLGRTNVCVYFIIESFV
jgi:hypothetical protein